MGFEGCRPRLSSTTRRCRPPRASSRRRPGTQPTAAAKALTKDDVAGLGPGPRPAASRCLQSTSPVAGSTTLTTANPRSPPLSRSRASSPTTSSSGSRSRWTCAELGAGWCGEAFGQGKAAMTMEGTWLFPPLDNDFPDIKYDVVELPKGAAAGQPVLHERLRDGRRLEEQGGRLGAAPVPGGPRRHGQVDQPGPGPPRPEKTSRLPRTARRTWPA